MQWRLFWGMMGYGALVGLLVPAAESLLWGMAPPPSAYLFGLAVGLVLVGFVNYVIVKWTLRNFLVRFLNQFNPLIAQPLPKPGNPLQSTELDHLDELFARLMAQLREYVSERVARQTQLERLQRYFPQQLAEQLARDAESLDRSAVANVTVMFADIRSFTNMSSRIEPPTRIVEILNDYFTAMIDPIQARGGTVLKLIGDEVMAVFGAPVPLSDDAARAVEAAEEMHRRFAALQEEWRRRGLDLDIGLGIGLNRGQVVVGNIGSPHHLDYTVIGDPVNVASRLQHVAQRGETILSRTVAEALNGRSDGLEPRDPVLVKGKDEPQSIYCLR